LADVPVVEQQTWMVGSCSVETYEHSCECVVLPSVVRQILHIGRQVVLRVVILICLAINAQSIIQSNAAGAEPTKFGVVSLTVEKAAANCAYPCDRDLIIFVHGILGSRETWVNPQTRAYWPELIASDPQLREFDVARLDYEGYLLAAGPSIEDVVADMQKAVASLNTLKYRTVQFIAHSLGGNLVRRYLLHVKARYGHRYLSRFRLVITLGTPGKGSYFAKIAQLASTNQQLRVLQPLQVNDWLQMLNATLRDLSDKHKNTYCSSLKFAAAVETEPTAVGIVVDQASAIEGADNYMLFARDHVWLAKPASQADDVYKWVRSLMLDCSTGLICPGPHLSTMAPDCGNEDH
jgi:pimeloyl-ACP methyl ester carboxylesterase